MSVISCNARWNSWIVILWFQPSRTEYNFETSNDMMPQKATLLVGREFIPPLGCQNRDESWLHWAGFVCSQRWGFQLASWCSGARLEVHPRGSSSPSKKWPALGPRVALWPGHSSDVGVGGQCFCEDYTQFPLHHQRQYCDSGQWLFSFTKVECEGMRNCPSGDVCQTFRDGCCNVSFGRGWGKREEMLRVVCITVVREVIKCIVKSEAVRILSLEGQPEWRGGFGGSLCQTKRMSRGEWVGRGWLTQSLWGGLSQWSEQSLSLNDSGQGGRLWKIADSWLQAARSRVLERNERRDTGR